MLLPTDDVCYEEHEKEVRRKAKILEKTFKNFGFNVKVVEIETGPVIAQFEVELEAGLRLSKITGLADDLAIALRVPSVRIVAPIPGKNTVGIEVPNENRQLVRLREVIEETNGRAKRMKIPLYLGKDVAGNPLAVDLTTLPHLLIAGRTGTGKSVCLNSIIVSMLMTPRARRSADADDRPEDGRAQRLPQAAAPDAPGRHRHAQGRGDPGLGRRQDGRALRTCWPAPACGTSRVYNQLGDEELRERIRARTRRAEWEPIPRQSAVHRDRGRRDGRPDDDRRQGRRAAHHPPRPEEPGGRHPPDPRHAEADGRRDHRPDQVEPAGPHRVPGGQPHRQPRRARRNGRRQAARQRRHAVPARPARARCSAARARSCPTTRSRASSTSSAPTRRSSPAS